MCLHYKQRSQMRDTITNNGKYYVEGVAKSDIMSAFNSEVTDYEDAVQASCAARIKADYIVTRNITDFVKSSIDALLPSQVLELIVGR